jgi:hypothetical protein
MTATPNTIALAHEYLDRDLFLDVLDIEVDVIVTYTNASITCWRVLPWTHTISQAEGPAHVSWMTVPLKMILDRHPSPSFKELPVSFRAIQAEESLRLDEGFMKVNITRLD